MSLDVDLYFDVVDLPGARHVVYEDNITHNLATMADAAGVCAAMWRPDELGLTRAAQLIPFLRDGLLRLLARPDRFRALNAPNGWGTYDDLVRFVENYLEACEKWPLSKVEVSR